MIIRPQKIRDSRDLGGIFVYLWNRSIFKANMMLDLVLGVTAARLSMMQAPGLVQ